MVVVVIGVLVSLVVSAVVVAYVAWPHRGETMPLVPWLGDAMGRAAEAAPTLDEDELELIRRS